MSADVSVDKSVGVFVGMSVGVSVGVAVGSSVNVSVGDRGLPWYAVGAAVEIAVEIVVEICMASTTRLHGVPLLAAAFRGSPWNVRGSSWKVRGSPWSVRGCPRNAVDMAMEYRGAPRTLPRCSVKKTNKVHPSTMFGHRRDAHEVLTAGRGAAMWWLRLLPWTTYS